ncbi:hypothetical protein [Sulfitobacter sp. R18_1]|uniref:hypothetical protein n=1 Tax=Sulfitobacter sp. R18_1 TaxID=2821104 RepID=UPI001ADAD87E|nr:hypothetical protein [Sulfitobacter sp. R18_1]MBO9428729.1 hypothetical protein [Sulfitobacter sp. R18_1]
MHMAAGSAGAFGAYQVTKSRKAACATAVALGVGKELYDSTGRGNVEAMDIVATAVPCLTLAIEF